MNLGDGYSLAENDKLPKDREFIRIPYLSWGAPPKETFISDFRSSCLTQLVITEKMEGFLFSMERQRYYVHPKASVKEKDMVKDYWSFFKPDIHPSFQLFGVVSMFSHRNYYSKLPSYMMFHTVYDKETGSFLGWDSTLRIVNVIKGHVVPILFEFSLASSDQLREITEELINTQSLCGMLPMSGLVVRRRHDFLSISSDLFMGQLDAQQLDKPTYYPRSVVKNGLG